MNQRNQSIKEWTLPEPLTETIDQELSSFPQLHRELLFRRGIEDASQAEGFLAPSIARFGDSSTMLDMPNAIDRLLAARSSGERIAVFGDYDADGVTATALLHQAFLRCGLQSTYYVPDRFSEGYGLNLDAIQTLANEGVELIVTVDCGIRAIEQVDFASSLGLDVIITDHHLPGPGLPNALAVIDPKREGDPYPHKEFSGVGLAWKLARSLEQELQTSSNEDDLGLVAIGTIADLVPLVGENRDMVAVGLQRLREAQNIGISALGQAAGVIFDKLSGTDIGFGLGPRLNAAGRLDSAKKAVELLCAQDSTSAEELAEELDHLNKERRRLTQVAVEQIRSKLDGISDDMLLIMERDSEYHEGVVGLIASRLVESFYRPAIVGNQGHEYTKASARSIPQFHITNALESCSNLLVKFGGHAAAAGFTVRNEHYEELRAKLTSLAYEALGEVELRECISVDAVVEFNDLDEDLLFFLDRMEPFGQGNKPPVFATFGVDLASVRRVGAKGDHLKLSLGNSGKIFDAIGFRMGGMASGLESPIDLVYRFEWNEYLGVTTPQIHVLDLKTARV